MESTIYLSSSSGLTFLTGSEADDEQYTSITLEADFILPKVKSVSVAILELALQLLP